MSEKITPEVFDKLAELAALELAPEEAEYLRVQLNAQLTSIDELMAVPLDDETPIAAHGVSFNLSNSQPVRNDTHIPSKNAEAILKQSPEIQDRYIVVPDIPMEDLD